MNIRRATINDAESLSIIASKTFYDTFTGTCTTQDMDDFLVEYFNINQVTKELENPNDFYYLYEIDNEIIGYIRLAEGNDGFAELQQYKALELKRLYILNEFHGKGIAQALMNFVFEFANINGYNAVWLGVWEHNYKAQKFYKKYDFVDTGYTHPFPIGSTPQTDVWYWKIL